MSLCARTALPAAVIGVPHISGDRSQLQETVQGATSEAFNLRPSGSQTLRPLSRAQGGSVGPWDRVSPHWERKREWSGGRRFEL